eukprot:PITA_04149
MENLKMMKKATISWEKDRKEKQNEEYSWISEELQKLESTEEDGYASQESKERILHLEKLKSKILMAREEEWFLKSREIWLKNLFTDPGEITIAEVIKTAQCFPKYVEEEEVEDHHGPVSKEEVESVIKSMAKEKSLGPDGWTIELFLHFFDLIGAEITEVVEESRMKGEVYNPFNATFIALIPKKEVPETFEAFRPISLCNSIYKIIAKVIATRIKPILSRHISMEQFGFLNGRQIHEAIGTAQEVLHSVKQKNKMGVVLKIDLSKAYD